jgi:hypothetical protein
VLRLLTAIGISLSVFLLVKTGSQGGFPAKSARWQVAEKMHTQFEHWT